MPESEQRTGGRRLRNVHPFSDKGCPTVSIVTAVYNARDCLADCIESVRSQDYPNIEFIVVDAASSDGTLDIIRRYEENIDVWVSEPDDGIFDAWNKGLDLATGDWIAFLGADDTYVDGAIRKYMDMARRNPGKEFLCSKAQLVHFSGYAPVFGGEWAWPAFAKAMTTIHVGTMHGRSLFERVGRFDSSYKIAGDYEFLLRDADNLRSAFMPEKTVMMRAGGASDSTAGLYEARRAKVERGVRAPVFAWLDLIELILRFHARRWILLAYTKFKR